MNFQFVIVVYIKENTRFCRIVSDFEKFARVAGHYYDVSYKTE